MLFGSHFPNMFKLAPLTDQDNELMFSYDIHVFWVFSGKLRASLVYVVDEYNFLTGVTKVININWYRYALHIVSHKFPGPHKKYLNILQTFGLKLFHESHPDQKIEGHV